MTAGIHINRCHGLGGFNSYPATRRQINTRVQRLVDCAVNIITIEQYFTGLALLNKCFSLRHNFLTIAACHAESCFTLNSHRCRVRAYKVTQAALNPTQILMQQTGGVIIIALIQNISPDTGNHLHVFFKQFIINALCRCPKHPTGKPIHTFNGQPVAHCFGKFDQSLSLLVIFYGPRHGNFCAAGCQNCVAPGQANICGELRSLITISGAIYLNQNRVTIMHTILNRCIAVSIDEKRTGFARTKKPVRVFANIDKCRLQSWNNTGNFC